jgi:hypothetical protein
MAGNFMKLLAGLSNVVAVATSLAALLPDPLRLKNGLEVTNAMTWWKQRRPEILEDFQREVYGRIPTNTPKVTWEVTAVDTNAMEGTTIGKSLRSGERGPEVGDGDGVPRVLERDPESCGGNTPGNRWR